MSSTVGGALAAVNDSAPAVLPPRFTTPRAIDREALGEVLASPEIAPTVREGLGGDPAEYLDRIFDKFFRITAADRVTGTGLGLSVCRGSVEAHGGRLWAENVTPPPGLAFNFTLPLVWEGASAASAPAEAE